MSDNARAGPLTFSKARRLTSPSEFLRVKNEGRAQRGALLILGVLDLQNDAPFRAGFVTSRRVGGAVVRNQVRRRLREIVRRNQYAVRPGCWLVSIARPRAAGADYRTLELEWLRLARCAGVLAPETI